MYLRTSKVSKALLDLKDSENDEEMIGIIRTNDELNNDDQIELDLAETEDIDGMSEVSFMIENKADQDYYDDNEDDEEEEEEEEEEDDDYEYDDVYVCTHLSRGVLSSRPSYEHDSER